ncbi:MAG: class I SAM-dependent methyltransferase [Streptosporangiaceae bacterium]
MPPSGRALDIGCGLGTEAAHLHRAGWRVAGPDLSAVALAAARPDGASPALICRPSPSRPPRSAIGPCVPAS